MSNHKFFGNKNAKVIEGVFSKTPDDVSALSDYFKVVFVWRSGAMKPYIIHGKYIDALYNAVTETRGVSKVAQVIAPRGSELSCDEHIPYDLRNVYVDMAEYQNPENLEGSDGVLFKDIIYLKHITNVVIKQLWKNAVPKKPAEVEEN